MLVKVDGGIDLPQEFEQVVVCGDPGCDGYNVEAIAVLETILRVPATFAVVVGDFVPLGNRQQHEHFRDIVNNTAKNPVYVVPGNHDIAGYEDYFGRRNYFIRTPGSLFVFLDNSARIFSAQTLDFLSTCLAENKSENIYLFFHIPPPNPLMPNSVSQEQWEAIKARLSPYRDAVRFLFCGHIHGSADFVLDGYRIVITGGAGALFDPVDSAGFHYFLLSRNQGILQLEKIELDSAALQLDYSVSEASAQVEMNLQQACAGEAFAYRRYLKFARIAAQEQLPGLARLFTAVADSEYYHWESMYRAVNGPQDTRKNLETALAAEEEEYQSTYRNFLEQAAALPVFRAEQAFYAAMEAEHIHARLFREALQKLDTATDIPLADYWTCERCGFTHKGDEPPGFCPGCGTDRYKFHRVVPRVDNVVV